MHGRSLQPEPEPEEVGALTDARTFERMPRPDRPGYMNPTPATLELEEGDATYVLFLGVNQRRARRYLPFFARCF